MLDIEASYELVHRLRSVIHPRKGGSQRSAMIGKRIADLRDQGWLRLVGIGIERIGQRSP
jgi:hypothetical protein